MSSTHPHVVNAEPRRGDSEPPRRKSYHHGALRSALIEAGIALAREGGPERVILREAARAAGVSHSAAYRHFADRDALLAEVSRYARNELAAKMRRRVKRARDPRKRLEAVGMAYVDFALAQPGLFRTAFTSHPPTSEAEVADGVGRASGGGDDSDPFEILGQVLDQAEAAGLMDPHRRPGAEIGAWSAVHGLASLLLDGPLPANPANVEFARGQVLTLIERGLLNEA
ncbi:TetR/AcrR family transcriptional regulator [Nocardia sp. NEAU-G5]|uniref:TetR/AcrR family transcriptional regulator n=1 Tax=Nocardia albiluteola TaxID=2842303 RepID=A0ABS6AUB5_9NOCA|nr:TetR/AcrR family transcriptional regulator [Nocardia albiluteola]MBU3061607.1 TetR/AcrR family transcriptional regulator [Nocardia albiluteola]